MDDTDGGTDGGTEDNGLFRRSISFVVTTEVVVVGTWRRILTAVGERRDDSVAVVVTLPLPDTSEDRADSTATGFIFSHVY